LQEGENMSASVVLNQVTKKYKMYNKTSEKLLDLAFPKGYGKDFYALQNISFQAEKGDIIGIIGVNGAGKSTISNIIAGIVPPSSGTVTINGDASLIAIAAGLNNELTGRENIELKCLMLGFKKKQIEELMPEIIEFAEIGDFIDQPVKKYSSGMKSRLGFAISVTIDPDILVIDEALSVGDKIFAQKCLDKMNSFKEKGKTIFFISHSIGQIKEFCQKALWLEAGEVRAYGSIDEVVPKYEQFIKDFNKMSKEEKKQFNENVAERRSTRREPQGSNDMSTSMEIKGQGSNAKGIKLYTFFFLIGIVIMSLFLFTRWYEFFSFFPTR
jgi:teichoic acid transport system ATP-binding protein